MEIDVELYNERAKALENRHKKLTRWVYGLCGLGAAMLFGIILYFVMFINGFVVAYYLLVMAAVGFMVSSILSAVLVAIRDNPPRKRSA